MFHFFFFSILVFMDIISYFSEYDLHSFLIFFFFYFDPCRVKWLALDWWGFFSEWKIKKLIGSWAHKSWRIEFTKGVSGWGVFLLSWSASPEESTEILPGNLVGGCEVGKWVSAFSHPILFLTQLLSLSSACVPKILLLCGEDTPLVFYLIG